MNKFTSLAFLVVAGAGMLSAQEGSFWSGFTYQLGAGYTVPVGRTQLNTDIGWNVTGGVGVRLTPWAGVNVDLGYNQLGINAPTLGGFGAKSGGLDIFSATLDPVIHLTPHHMIDFYLTGGGGVFYRDQSFTAGGPVNSAFFGNTASYISTRPGIDVGAGMALGTRNHGRIFMEAKYNRIFTSDYSHTDYIPVTFGVRW